MFNPCLKFDNFIAQSSRFDKFHLFGCRKHLFTQAVDRGGLVKRNPGGSDARTPGAFVYDNPRAARWNFDAGVWLNGYWTHDWDNHSVRAARYGAENGTNHVVRLAAAERCGQHLPRVLRSGGAFCVCALRAGSSARKAAR